MSSAHLELSRPSSDDMVVHVPTTRITNLIAGQRTSVVIALAFTAILAAGDRATGIDLPFTILYLLPIGLVSWVRSRAFGLLLTVLATGSIVLSLVHEHMTPISIAWNGASAVALFGAASWIVDRLRGYVDHERAQHRMAVEQLRHAERLNVIGTLAAGVAHELGTPLNVIAGCAEIIADETTDEGARRRTSMILGQVDKISAIVRKLVDFGHRGGVQRKDIDLRALADATIEMLGSTTRKRDSSILLDGSSVHVDGDAAELEQVLSNLILNALQAMERGTVRVRVSTVDSGGQRLARLEVEDNGCGIAPENLARIFDPFFTTKGVGEGTGLGLSVAFGIVRDHHGTIEVRSELGRGSCFTVLLPRHH